MQEQKARDLFGRLMSWFESEKERQSENRYQMAIDADYYDSIQWSPEDAQVLEERGQLAVVMNKIKPTVDWIIGTERRSRIDYNVLPREEDDVKGAATKTKVIKYVRDVNHAEFHRSRAFDDALKVGIGWLEDRISTEPGEELLKSNYENWRNILYDSLGAKESLNPNDGWRYIFRFKYVDLDIAKAFFPQRKNLLEKASVDADTHIDDDDDIWYLGSNLNYNEYPRTPSRRAVVNGASQNRNGRQRVKIYECWYREPMNTHIVRGEVFDGEIYDPNNPVMARAVEDQVVSLHATVKMQMRVALFTDSDLIMDVASPYKHNRFPFTPIWAYRRDRDGMCYGVVRPIRDPQDDFNKRHSKSLHILSARTIIADHDALDYGGEDGTGGGDWDELREEAARPDAVIIKKKSSTLEINSDNALAAQHIDLMNIDARMIQDVAGVTDENLGKSTNATSGIALERRQEQGSVLTTELFDNLRYASLLQGELQLSLIEQFYTERKVIRIVGNKDKSFEWLKVNDRDPDTGEVMNDITAFKADFIIDERDFKASVRQAMFEYTGEILTKIATVNPQAAMQLLDVWVEMADIPNKDDLVQRIRQINGQHDPDAEMSPEQRQAYEQQQQQQAQQQELQMQAVMLELEEKSAKVAKLRAEAEKIMSEIATAGEGDVAGQQSELARVQAEYQQTVQDLQYQIQLLNLKLNNKQGELDNDRFKAILDNQTRLKVADKAAVRQVNMDRLSASPPGRNRQPTSTGAK